MKHALLLLALTPAFATPEVSLPALFSDHMVLQQGQKVPVWGWADAGENITVSFGNQKKTATAGAEKTWRIDLEPLKANATPTKLSIAGASNTIDIEDVLVGEVWVCSGQSNMAWTVSRAKDPEGEKAAANLPQIRHFKVALKTAIEPATDCTGAWEVTSPDTVSNFTAVGYFFGRDLHQRLNVPVGLINTSWGGTRSEAWTSRSGLERIELAQPILATWQEAQKNWNREEAEKTYQERLAKWKERAEKLKAEGKGKRPGRRPQQPAEPRTSRHAPSTLFNAMISPLVPYAIKGAIWYQGESNSVRAHQYRKLFPGMIADWRAHWGQGDFPFYFVQLANFRAPSTEPGTPNDWAELQEAQLLTLKALPKTGMATINDIGDAKDIHPKNKQDVGRRLARWALANDYGKKGVIASGPLYKEMKIEDGKIRISFDYAGGGLKSRDGGPLKRFEIAGEDKVWHWADAKIDGTSVVVSSGAVTKPAAVRYAWASNPQGANLVNSDGLPASLFRTDDWPGVTVGKNAPRLGR